MIEPLLDVKNLTVGFATNHGRLKAVENISFSIPHSGTLGVVGESGCGKSVTSLAIMQLIDTPPGFYEGGEILFEGKNILTPGGVEKLRGVKISMIFQEPMTSLNPVFTIGEQIAEVYRNHGAVSRSEAKNSAIEMLNLVKIPEPRKRYGDYPHQLSGGMRQRVMIAIALACRPQLLIADEPTTALDVTIQAQILDLISELKEKINTSVLFITHDLGVVSQVCENVMVMYGGKIVERGEKSRIFNTPKHPYTQGLLSSIPKLGKRVARLDTIPGQVPALGQFPKGCRFQNRCRYAQEKCAVEEPTLGDERNGHSAACWFPLNA